MAQSLQTLEMKISGIEDELRDAYYIPVDKEKIRRIRTNIANLLEESVAYLKEIYSTMSPWQKDQIVEAINAIYWDWLHLALSSIRGAIADPSTIAPENKYKEEIVKLTDGVLIEQIPKVKSYVAEANRR